MELDQILDEIAAHHQGDAQAGTQNPLDADKLRRFYFPNLL
jgi:hypothetical protein